jgi:hypothetical protein
MVSEEDWRLHGQEKYLTGLTLYKKRWVSDDPQWDHDHCEFCMVKFMDVDEPDVLREGYATADNYRWICNECFNDFRDRFGWTLVE